MKLLTARFVAPVAQPMIVDGAVLLRGGRVVGVGSRKDFAADSRIDYGDAVICPGFVNAHTHLELSGLAGRVPPDGDFSDWLQRLVGGLPTRDATDGIVERAVQDGITQSVRAGVTLVGDITREPVSTRPVLTDSNLRAVSFGEVIAIGNQRSKLHERISNALPGAWTNHRVRLGISPHAPYTVEPTGLTECAERAAASNVRLCIHLSESPEELEFTQSATGALADHLKRLGFWDDGIAASSCRPVELVRRCGLLTNRTLCAHVNYVTDPEITVLKEAGVCVVYCPRTHAAFGHEPHRFRDMRRAGITVAIGTDSLASNPSLSVLEELRFLHRHHEDVPPDTLLEMGTQCGAKALGWADEAGAIAIGMPGDLVVVPIDQSSRNDGVGAMLRSSAPPLGVYISGVLQNRPAVQ